MAGTCAVRPRPTPLCTAPNLVRNRAFVRSSTGLPITPRVFTTAPSTKRPSWSCRFVKHPARSASASSSTKNYYWSFSAPYIHTQLRSLAHHASDCELPIPHDRTAMALFFSAARLTSPLNPRGRLSDELGRGSRSSGLSDELGRGSRSSSGCHVVVVVSLFALLGRCVVQRSTERRLFLCFSRESPPRAHPDRRPDDMCYGFYRPAGLRSSPDFHFGHSRLAPGGCLMAPRGKSDFFFT